MIQIKIKRVYDDPEPGDGYRVLVDRIWPRGIKKACLSYDEWAKEITPSPGLRTWFHDDISRHWEEFTSMYKEELEHSQAVKDFLSGSNLVICFERSCSQPCPDSTELPGNPAKKITG